MIPSARTIEVIMPAPRASGAAMVRFPTRPIFTRTNSSSPMGDTTARGITASSIGRGGRRRPSPASMSGATKSSMASAADTGYPGMPTTARPRATPRTTGWPGRIATPCTSTSPRSAITRAVKSSVPADEPALITTMSARSSASSTAARRRAKSSGIGGERSASAPHSRAAAASMSEFESTISPGPASAPGGTSSEPVGRTATCGGRRTSIDA